jgi:hypothetical protein
VGAVVVEQERGVLDGNPDLVAYADGVLVEPSDGLL